MWNHIINIYQSELLGIKIKESRNNEDKKKRTIYIFDLIIFLQDFLKS